MPELAAAKAAPRRVVNKIKPLDELRQLLLRAKSCEKRITLCHGVFDLLHIGHIRHFDEARRRGDLLVVTVTPDQFVNKGSHRPVFPARLRAEAIAALDVVNYVAINQWPTAVETIRMLRPDVYCKGGEYRHAVGDAQSALMAEIEAVVEVGGRIEYTDDITFSSSQLLNDYFSVFPPEVERWLKAFKKRHSLDEVLGYLDRAATLRPLVVGEAIIDEYVFCDGLGKSTKDPVLAFQYRSSETHAGGSLAVANHLAGFCPQVELVGLLGDSDPREDFVRQSLSPNVCARFVRRRNAPTIQKRRFVDTHTGARMFELYLMNDEPLQSEDEVVLTGTLNEVLEGQTPVVVADYGHGMLTRGAIELLCKRARFLTVNTQANAGNRGFNTISRYPRADYTCLNAFEIALETRLRHADQRDLVREVAKRIDCARFTVTQGKEGMLHYTSAGEFTEVPALAVRVADRVGAGDAVLAITSLLVVQDAPWDIVGFVGNVAGAQMVADLGNRVVLNKTAVARHVASLMK
jgi:rfaE bifunctional protein kinase chain/domain